LQVWPAEGEVFSDLNLKIDASQPAPGQNRPTFAIGEIVIVFLGILSELVGAVAV
jgi:hypothetical protein